MAIDERDIRKILGNQSWMRDALGELLANNATIIANQTTQITALKDILKVLEIIRDERTTQQEALMALQAIQRAIELMLNEM